MSIIEKILAIKQKKQCTLFTTPSHSQGKFIVPTAKKILGKRYYESDYSEIEGLDNLSNPTGIIKLVQDNFTQIYDTKNTFLLTNGSSSGILASIIALLNKDDKVLITRNCHISVYNALVLSGAKPIWIMPEFDNDWGIFKEISPSIIEEKLSIEQNIKAVVITSPTYEGIFSDIKTIAEICKKNNVLLIVDEAHGALLNFSKYKSKSALTNGADLCIHSLHKTAGAPNPCALLHINKGSSVESQKIQDALNLINTTSPSYPLLCAIEATVNYLATKEGRNKIDTLYKNIEYFKSKLDKKIKIYSDNDNSKILIKIEGISSSRLATILNEKFLIEEEYTNTKSLLFLTGLGTDKKKLLRLCKVLNKIQVTDSEQLNEEIFSNISLPQMIYTPMEAKSKVKKSVNLEDAIGKICGEVILKYPPGVPLLLPGEIITTENIHNIEKNEITILA